MLYDKNLVREVCKRYGIKLTPGKGMPTLRGVPMTPDDVAASLKRTILGSNATDENSVKANMPHNQYLNMSQETASSVAMTFEQSIVVNKINNGADNLNSFNGGFEASIIIPETKLIEHTNEGQLSLSAA